MKTELNSRIIIRRLQQHKKELRDKYGVKEIGVFGSFVKGKQTKKSDIDIFVEFYKIPDLLEFIELERHFKRILGKKIDLVRKQSIREELKVNILKEAMKV